MYYFKVITKVEASIVIQTLPNTACFFIVFSIDFLRVARFSNEISFI